MTPRPMSSTLPTCRRWARQHKMKSVVRPELPTASVGSSQAPTDRRRGQLCTVRFQRYSETRSAKCEPVPEPPRRGSRRAKRATQASTTNAAPTNSPDEAQPLQALVPAWATDRRARLGKLRRVVPCPRFWLVSPSTPMSRAGVRPDEGDPTGTGKERPGHAGLEHVGLDLADELDPKHAGHYQRCGLAGKG